MTRATRRDVGFLLKEGDRIGLTRAGLWPVDRLLQEFFPPEHRTGRCAWPPASP